MWPVCPVLSRRIVVRSLCGVGPASAVARALAWTDRRAVAAIDAVQYLALRIFLLCTPCLRAASAQFARKHPRMLRGPSSVRIGPRRLTLSN